MNTFPLALLCLTLVAPFAATAQPEGKRRQVHPGVGGLAEMAEALKVFDKNGNHRIDADELPAMQQAFSAMKTLDKNANGEIETGELETARAEVAGQMRSRAAEAMKHVDKNGNHKIDADEIDSLQQVLAKAPPEMMKRLDQNGDGKLDESEVARLNERLANFGTVGGGGRRPGGSSLGTPGFRRPPEKSPDPVKPAETIKPAEKPAAEQPKPKFDKPETPPNKFGS